MTEQSQVLTSDHAEKNVVSWFELFYDLVLVAAFSQAGKVFVKSPTWDTTALIAVATCLLALVWFMTTLSYGIFHQESGLRRILVVVQMFAMLLASLSLGKYGLANWVGFASLGVVFLSVAALYTNHNKSEGQSRLPNNLLAGASFAAGLLSLILALLISPASAETSRWAAPALLLLLTLVVAIPLLGPYLRTTAKQSRFNFPHLEERLGLLVIIVLGEQFVSLVALLGSKGSIPNPVAFLIALLTAFAIWSLYFTGRFDLTPPTTTGLLRLWLLMHVVLVFGCVSVATEFSSLTLDDVLGSQTLDSRTWTPIPVTVVVAAILMLALIKNASPRFIQIQVISLSILVVLTIADFTLGNESPSFAFTGALVLLADALASFLVTQARRNKVAH